MMTALITGATSGIGYELSKILSKNGYNLVITSRNIQKLNEVKNELELLYHNKVECIRTDLSKINDSLYLYDEIIKKNITIDILINNAGRGNHDLVIDTDVNTTIEMINLNITALTMLTQLFLKDMVVRKQGKILNVASTCAFSPDPFFSIYAATKSYDLMFSKSLAGELKDTGVSISVLCPGPTKTAFSKNAKRIEYQKADDPSKVALAGYKGLMKGKLVIFPDFKTKFAVFISKLLPNKLLTKWMFNYQKKLKKPNNN